MKILLFALIASLQSSAWDFERETDPITDQTVVRAFINADDGTALGFKCDRSGRGSVYVHIISSGVLGGNGLARFTYRFDTGSPVNGYWRYDLRSAFLIRNKRAIDSFARSAMTADKLTVRLHRYDNRTDDVVFSMAGADQVIPKVYAACNDTLA